GILPLAAVLPPQQAIGLLVTDDPLLLAVPLHAAPELVREHPEQADVRGAVDRLDVADRPAPFADRRQEVRPQLADVLIVGPVEFRLFLDHGLVAIGGIELPAVDPAHVEGALGSVEVASDVLALLRVVARELPVLP